MNLKEYLFREKKWIAEFAREIDYSRNTINMVANGLNRPGKKLVKKIFEHTKGQVTIADLLETYEERHSNGKRRY